MSGAGIGSGDRIWEIVLEVPGAGHVAAFEDALALFSDTVSSFEIEGTAGIDGTPRWRIAAHAEAAPDEAAVRARIAAVAADAGIAAPDIAVAIVPETDWVAAVERTLVPIHVPPFYLFGSHVTDPAPAGAIPIRIDAGLAFGTGNHETTKGCLSAIARISGSNGAPPARILDVGTGSGILAIAAAKYFGVAVVASDIDPIAVEVARENAEINGVGDAVVAVTCAGLGDAAIRSRGPYDLVFANIVANPLIELAPDIAAALVPGGDGRVVLSGILGSQRDAVAAAYAACGLAVTDEIPLGEWVTLVLGQG